MSKYKKSRRGRTLVSKSGKLNASNKKNIDAFKNEIMSSKEYTDAEKRGLIADLNIIIKQRMKDGKKLTTTGFFGELASDKIERMLVNAGYSIEEASEELGVSESELLDMKNWSGDKFTHAKDTWLFSFKYTGAAFTKI